MGIKLRRKPKKHKPCPITCGCLCHDTGGADWEHKGQPCPGKKVDRLRLGDLLADVYHVRAENITKGDLTEFERLLVKHNLVLLKKKAVPGG